MLKSFILVISFIVLSSCERVSISKRIESIDTYAKHHHFVKNTYKGDKFDLIYYSKNVNKSKPFIFYIEGDGRAFIARQVSPNPTPMSNNYFFELATMDNRANVVYIARPCQYMEFGSGSVCYGGKYWSDYRYSEEVVHDMNKAMNQIAQGQKMHLIGFSGGGAIAILSAARNSNVESIITVAGNIDLHTFIKTHNRSGSPIMEPYLTSPIPGSLNPIDYANRISHIPQLHLSGSLDRIVPPAIAASYVERSNSPNVKQEIVEGAGHGPGWSAVWPKYMNW